MTKIKELAFIRSVIDLFKDFSVWSNNHKASAFLGILNMTLLLAIGFGAVWTYRTLKAPIEQIKEHSDIEDKKDAEEKKQNDLNSGLQEYMTKSIVIDRLLKRTQVTQGSDRAYLFMFHDSLVGVNGKHFFFMSNTNEVVGKGISREMNNLQKLPIAILGDWTNEFLNHRCVSSRIDTMSQNVPSKDILEAQGIRDVALCPIFENNNLSGYIGVDYTISGTNNFDITHLEESASEISDIMTK